MSQKYPETRESNIVAIAGELEKFRENDPMFNGLLIGTLVKLHAVETSNLIEQAFKAKKVDSFMLGDWEDVQLALGLITREEVEAIRLSAQQKRESLLSFPTGQTKKVVKGFGSTPSPNKKKSRKSSGKRKKS